MKTIVPLFLFVLFVPLGGQSLLAKDTKKNASPASDYTSLFNGKDLSHWKIPEGDNGHWKVLDGVIDYDALSEAPGDKSLWSEKSYGDFTLQVDWKIKRTTGLYDVPTVLPDGSYKLDVDGKKIVTPTPNADSGIYLRGTGKCQVNIWCWPIGSGEVYGYRNKQDDPVIRAGVTPKVHADNPVGEWNTFEITMKGDRLTVVLNGKTVIENAQLPGAPAEGPIGLQHHGGMKKDGEYSPASSLVQFRNIYIKEL